jgi:putative hydrolase of the HAD superfamily
LSAASARRRGGTPSGLGWASTPGPLSELHDDLASAGESDDALVACLGALRGEARLAALANAWPHLRTRLREARLEGLFDQVVLSCDVGFAKPDLRIYRLALERLGIAPGDALFVDRAENVDVA